MKVKPVRKYVIPAALALALPALASTAPAQTVFAKGGTSWFLPESLVVSTALEMFKKAGYSMEENVVYDANGAAFTLDLYDREAGVGFEFVDNGQTRPAGDAPPGTVLVLDAADKRFRNLDNVVQAVEDFLEHIEDDGTV